GAAGAAGASWLANKVGENPGAAALTASAWMLRGSAAALTAAAGTLRAGGLVGGVTGAAGRAAGAAAAGGAIARGLGARALGFLTNPWVWVPIVINEAVGLATGKTVLDRVIEKITGATKQDGPKTLDEIKEEQRQLKAAGLYNGPIDGIAGPGTEAGRVKRDELKEAKAKAAAAATAEAETKRQAEQTKRDATLAPDQLAKEAEKIKRADAADLTPAERAAMRREQVAAENARRNEDAKAPGSTESIIAKWWSRYTETLKQSQIDPERYERSRQLPFGPNPSQFGGTPPVPTMFDRAADAMTNAARSVADVFGGLLMKLNPVGSAQAGELPPTDRVRNAIDTGTIGGDIGSAATGGSGSVAGAGDDVAARFQAAFEAGLQISTDIGSALLSGGAEVGSAIQGSLSGGGSQIGGSIEAACASGGSSIASQISAALAAGVQVHVDAAGGARGGGDTGNNRVGR
ncbi:MAG: hypothetical protein JSS20_18155, partial [Proteobacteria bacterium]|nr:hypothetical protein [Pseudomonadota bacterium]